MDFATQINRWKILFTNRRAGRDTIFYHKYLDCYIRLIPTAFEHPSTDSAGSADTHLSTTTTKSIQATGPNLMSKFHLVRCDHPVFHFYLTSATCCEVLKGVCEELLFPVLIWTYFQLSLKWYDHGHYVSLVCICVSDKSPFRSSVQNTNLKSLLTVDGSFRDKTSVRSTLVYQLRGLCRSLTAKLEYPAMLISSCSVDANRWRLRYGNLPEKR